MKLIFNENDGCCESISIEYTPTEALIINQAMRRYVNDDEVNKTDRNIMKQMLDVKPIFVDVAESEERMKKEQKDRILKKLVDDRNSYAKDCDRRIEKEFGKIDGADYMLQRFLDILSADVEPQESEEV